MGLFSTIGKIVGNVVLPGIGGDLLGSLGAEIDGDRSRQQAKEANKDALKNQMELAKYTSGLEQENWQKRFDIENAYNDPSAMRDRLENAGINPNLVYGSLSPNMAANPHVGTHSGQLSAYQNAFDMSIRAKQQALDEMRVSNETRVSDSQVEKNKAEADKSIAEAEYKRTERDKLEAGRTYWQSNEYITNQIMDAELGIKSSDAAWRPRLNQKEEELKREQINNLLNEIDQQKKHFALAEKLNNAKIQELKASYTEIMERAKGIHIENNWKNASLFWSLISDVLDAGIKGVEFDIKNSDKTLKDFDVDQKTARELRTWIQTILSPLGFAVKM